MDASELVGKQFHMYKPYMTSTREYYMEGWVLSDGEYDASYMVSTDIQNGTVSTYIKTHRQTDMGAFLPDQFSEVTLKYWMTLLELKQIVSELDLVLIYNTIKQTYTVSTKEEAALALSLPWNKII